MPVAASPDIQTMLCSRVKMAKIVPLHGPAFFPEVSLRAMGLKISKTILASYTTAIIWRNEANSLKTSTTRKMQT